MICYERGYVFGCRIVKFSFGSGLVEFGRERRIIFKMLNIYRRCIKMRYLFI